MNNRKTGDNFNKKDAEDIFEKLKNVEGKIKKDNKKNLFGNVKDMMSEAHRLAGENKFSDAIELYKQVLVILPDSSKAYGAIADIYNKQGDVENEKDILKQAISNCSKNSDFKKRLERIS